MRPQFLLLPPSFPRMETWAPKTPARSDVAMALLYVALPLDTARERLKVLALMTQTLVAPPRGASTEGLVGPPL